MSFTSKVSEVSICNLALGWLGQDPIRSLEDSNNRAELCLLNYPNLRDAVIESANWKFAIRTEISQSNDRDLFGRGWIHKMNEEWLYIMRVYDEAPGWNPEHKQARWVMEEEGIITEKPIAYLWGIRRVEDTSQFSSLFVQALAARIAADLAIPLTQNRSLQADMWMLYNDKLQEAKVRDGQQGRAERTTATRLTTARSR